MSFSRQETHFLSSASTSVILPQNTTIPLGQILHDGAGHVNLQDIKQRDTLFFDELLTAYVVLHVQQCSEHELNGYLSRLQLKLEVWTTNENQTSERSAANTTRDVVCMETVKHDEDPIVLISQSDDDESVVMNLIWEVHIKLSKPRARAQAAHLTFSPVAAVSPLEHKKSREGFVKLFQPQASNLFEPLRGSRGFEANVPYLPLSRLDAVVPAPPKEDASFHVRSIASPSILTHLAFVTRLRLSKAISNHQSSSIASLEIEIIPFIDVRGQIEAADATLRNGQSRPLTQDMLPMECQSRDCIILLYELDQALHQLDTFKPASSLELDVLTVAIKLNLDLSDICHCIIDMQWVSNVDFVQPPNSLPHLSDLARRQLTGQHKQLSYDRNYNIPSAGGAPQSLNHHTRHDLLTISFTASNDVAKVGTPFSWRILIFNGTGRHVRLAIMPLARIQKPVSHSQQYSRRHATRSSITSFPHSEKNATDKLQNDVAQAVLDENVLYAVQHSSAISATTDLLSLTPELRIGPLGPGQCHEDELRFVAFKTGAFTLDAIRVVDLVKEAEHGHGSPGVITDIRDLPDVLVEDDSADL